jgi:hypothetical protein
MRVLSAAVGCAVFVWNPAVAAMSLLESSRMTVSALCFHICCSMGRRNDSTSRSVQNITSSWKTVSDIRREGGDPKSPDLVVVKPN